MNDSARSANLQILTAIQPQLDLQNFLCGLLEEVDDSIIATRVADKGSAVSLKTVKDLNKFFPDFQALPLNMAGYKLLLPLMQICEVIPVTSELKLRQDATAFACYGQYDYRHGKLKIYDLISLISIKSRQNFDKRLLQQPKYLIIPAIANIGIMVDSVAKIQRVDSKTVKWRSMDAKENIFWGVTINEKQLVVDLDALVC